MAFREGNWWMNSTITKVVRFNINQSPHERNLNEIENDKSFNNTIKSAKKIESNRLEFWKYSK